MQPISGAMQAGIRLLVDPLSTFTAVATATNNRITGNALGLDNTIATAPAVDARQNWWGCPAGPGNPGCDLVKGPVDASSPLPAPPGFLSAAADDDNNDNDHHYHYHYARRVPVHLGCIVR